MAAGAGLPPLRKPSTRTVPPEEAPPLPSPVAMQAAAARLGTAGPADAASAAAEASASPAVASSVARSPFARSIFPDDVAASSPARTPATASPASSNFASAASFEDFASAFSSSPVLSDLTDSPSPMARSGSTSSAEPELEGDGWRPRAAAQVALELANASGVRPDTAGSGADSGQPSADVDCPCPPAVQSTAPAAQTDPGSMDCGVTLTASLLGALVDGSLGAGDPGGAPAAAPGAELVAALARSRLLDWAARALLAEGQRAVAAAPSGGGGACAGGEGAADTGGQGSDRVTTACVAVVHAVERLFGEPRLRSALHEASLPGPWLPFLLAAAAAAVCDEGAGDAVCGGGSWGLASEPVAAARALLGLPNRPTSPEGGAGGRVLELSPEPDNPAVYKVGVLRAWALAQVPGLGPLRRSFLPPQAVYTLCIRSCELLRAQLTDPSISHKLKAELEAGSGSQGAMLAARNPPPYSKNLGAALAAALAAAAAWEAVEQAASRLGHPPSRRLRSRGIALGPYPPGPPPPPAAQPDTAWPQRWWAASLACISSAAAESKVVRGTAEEEVMWGDVAALLRRQLTTGQLARPMPAGPLPPTAPVGVAGALSAGALSALIQLTRWQGRRIVYSAPAGSAVRSGAAGIATTPSPCATLLRWPGVAWLLASGAGGGANRPSDQLHRLLLAMLRDRYDPLSSSVQLWVTRAYLDASYAAEDPKALRRLVSSRDAVAEAALAWVSLTQGLLDAAPGPDPAVADVRQGPGGSHYRHAPAPRPQRPRVCAASSTLEPSDRSLNSGAGGDGYQPASAACLSRATALLTAAAEWRGLVFSLGSRGVLYLPAVMADAVGAHALLASVVGPPVRRLLRTMIARCPAEVRTALRAAPQVPTGRSRAYGGDQLTSELLKAFRTGGPLCDPPLAELLRRVRDSPAAAAAAAGAACGSTPAGAPALKGQGRGSGRSGLPVDAPVVEAQPVLLPMGELPVLADR
ncbi:hypothetical protein HYH03_010776 [Edaphochlamys debaryana]|uniref:Uncharacterized protein n=1 Tax=Edaphochlamys debaryana TaxID=47281 RepID=A0A836BX58_9CHLO|nr:hypothetical protein HYH03_010776 [Edaphochlamys debaryana]|eukprot:KAG2490858.1 hypothetical protein HYH03_010776 [Edaphochlamys debaryana]